MKKMFISNNFEIVYDRDLDEPLADGFYFTISYPGMTGSKLIRGASLLWYKCHLARYYRKRQA